MTDETNAGKSISSTVPAAGAVGAVFSDTHSRYMYALHYNTHGVYEFK